MPLKKLIVENFQSISERTEFDLNKLVLLFGPNSAGKSIIEDAFTFIFEQLNLFNHNSSLTPFVQFRDSLSGEETLISRNWRRKGLKYEDSFCVGLGGLFDSENESLWYGLQNGEMASFEWYWEIKYYGSGNSFQDTLGRPDIESFWREWSFSVGEQPLITGGGIQVNHPLLVHFEKKLERLVSETSNSDSNLDLKDGLLSNGGSGCVLPVRGDNEIWKYLNESKSDDSKATTFNSDLHNALNELVLYVELLIKLTRSPALEPMKISDSRTIPSPADLSFIFHDFIYPETNLLGNTVCLPLRDDRRHVASRDTRHPQGLNVQNIDLFRELASGYFLQLPSIAVDFHEMFENRDWFDRVNAYLANFLFTDNGYQIDGEHAFILSETELQALAKKPPGSEGLVNSQVALTLMLRDAQGQKLHFNEVGSGIGYVLPILISLASDSDVINKQPELHLHPALQSQLGDLYLLAAKDDRYMVVETHSEHLLLRVLRRIRQRSNGKLDDHDYKFATPNDVSIYYFEPQGNGETKVRPIRISPEGDFLDPWPGGFFEERYEDLFYE